MASKVISHLSKAAVLTAIVLPLSIPTYATVYNITGTFTMRDPVGGLVGQVDNTLTGSYDDSDPDSMVIQTTQPFFGYIWNAYNLRITTTPGTYDVETCPTPADGSVVPLGGGVFVPCTPPLPMTMTIGAGQWGVEMLFDWNAASRIDVLNVWDVTENADGSIRLTSTDFDGDGIRSSGMADGPFQANNAIFDLLLTPPFNINLTATQNGGTPVLLDKAVAAGNLVMDATVTDAVSYDWSQSDAAILAAAGATNQAQLVIDQTAAGLVAGQTYTVKVSVVKITPSGTATSSTSTTVRVAPFVLTTTDTDGDTVADNVEGFIDTDGDRIPEFLDNTTSTLQLAVNPGDANAGNVYTSEGVLALGDSAYIHARDTLTSPTSNNFGAQISVNTIGVNDSNYISSFCLGGCFDILVTGVTSESINIVLPLSAPLEDHAIFRMYDSSGWSGFVRDANNSLGSAPASSTGPISCPAPGDTTYGDEMQAGAYCVQLTIEDGGPNDADGAVNGSVAILGGAADLKLGAPLTTGVGATDWLFLGLPALALVRHRRRKLARQ